jgi:Holliday junction resolvase RusA-like endonuclease
MGGHWSNRGKLKNADFMQIWTATRSIPAATQKRLVDIKVYISGSGRSPDPDNLCKSLLDGLVKAKLLKDDSATWCYCNPPEIIRGIQKGTEIFLQDI